MGLAALAPVKLAARVVALAEPVGWIRFEMPIKALPKERPRTNPNGGRSYTPKRTRRYESQIAQLALSVMRGFAPFRGPVECDLTFVLAVPEHWPDERKSRALAGFIIPARGDTDNLEKAVDDAFNRVVLEDDRFISKVVRDRIYGLENMVKVAVRRRLAPDGTPTEAG